MSLNIHSAKRSVYAVLFALLLVNGMFTSCASDNIHMPEPEDFTPVPGATSMQSFEGQLTTSLPQMPDFEPLINHNSIRLIWNDENHKRADVEVGAFNISVAEMGMNFTIGTMLIKDVACEAQGDGTYRLEKESFECQAGQYFTKGSLSGRFCDNGAMEVTLLYKPGSMPFQCKSVFETPEVQFPVVFDGQLTTSLPEMPDFAPILNDNSVKLIPNAKNSGLVDIVVGAFNVVVEQMNMNIAIGTMVIKDVTYTDNGDGTYRLEKETFECQAGQYFTKGSLSGKVQAGRLELALDYKPGSMPFLIHSTFSGTSEEKNETM